MIFLNNKFNKFNIQIYHLIIIIHNFLFYLLVFFIPCWGLGIWGLGIGDWGLGIGPNPQSPIPISQSPIPNPP
jgi:hypothetical protein